MESEGSLSCSQGLATGPYPRGVFNSLTKTIFLVLPFLAVLENLCCYLLHEYINEE